jgi:hypothetical protein
MDSMSVLISWPPENKVTTNVTVLSKSSLDSLLVVRLFKDVLSISRGFQSRSVEVSLCVSK